MLQEQKQKAERLKEGPQYKVYTMDDYKKLKLEYKLGGLGPSRDPDEIREKVRKLRVIGFKCFYYNDQSSLLLFSVASWASYLAGLLSPMLVPAR